MKTFIAHLEIRQHSNYLSAICSEVPGLHLIDATLEGLHHRALTAIPVLLKANRHMNVKVAPTDDMFRIRITEI